MKATMIAVAALGLLAGVMPAHGADQIDQGANKVEKTTKKATGKVDTGVKKTSSGTKKTGAHAKSGVKKAGSQTGEEMNKTGNTLQQKSK